MSVNDDYAGDDRRKPDPVKAEIKAIVTEAVKEALKNANVVDGPTHIAHHLFLEEQLSLMRHAKKTVVGALILALVALLSLGLTAWKMK